MAGVLTVADNTARENAARLLEDASKNRHDGRRHTQIIAEAQVWADVYRADVIAG